MVGRIKKDGSAVDFNPFRDLTKPFEQFKMPGADVTSFVDARRKDVEAWSPRTRSPDAREIEDPNRHGRA